MKQIMLREEWNQTDDPAVVQGTKSSRTWCGRCARQELRKPPPPAAAGLGPSWARPSRGPRFPRSLRLGPSPIHTERGTSYRTVVTMN